MSGHPAVRDAYERGFQDGVLTTLDELEKSHPDTLGQDVRYWAETVRGKVKSDRPAQEDKP